MLRYLSQQEVVGAFGDPAPYVRMDGTVLGQWESDILGAFFLPAPLPLAWDRSRLIRRIRCHRKVALHMEAAFRDIYADQEAWRTIDDFGGCYSWRCQRGSKTLSRHCWAIAIDIDVADNPLGDPGQMDPRVISAFEKHGFMWGGGFHRPDPMHLEWADIDRI